MPYRHIRRACYLDAYKSTVQKHVLNATVGPFSKIYFLFQIPVL